MSLVFAESCGMVHAYACVGVCVQMLFGRGVHNTPGSVFVAVCVAWQLLCRCRLVCVLVCVVHECAWMAVQCG